MNQLQRQFANFIEFVCDRFNCNDANAPLQEGFTALCESITEPTMRLRKSYRNRRTNDCPDTPKFNEVWHRYERYDGSDIALDVAMDNWYLVRRIVEKWEDGGKFPEICEKYKEDDDFLGMSESDIKELMELDPETVTDVIRHSEEYYSADRKNMDFNHTVVNGWLVHNSDSAWDIWVDGFKYGNDIGQLAYSGAGSTAGKDYGDYLFAFPIGDAPAPDRHGLKYGDASIVFIGTGNEFWHYGDEENQVVFDRREPKGCFIVAQKEMPNEDGYGDYWCVIGENEFHPLYHSEEYEDCLAWIVKNGNRYLKSMRMWDKATSGRQVESERVWK